VSTHQITGIKTLEIMDNRGNPTIRTYVTVDEYFTGTADVPSGSSTGSFEAKELRDGETRYSGMGVRTAIEHIKTEIMPALMGQDPANQRAIDRIMIDLDGTPDKSRLGGNAILGVSLATAKAAALALGLPLYQYLNNGAHVLPVPQACLLNGGLHAGNDLDIQEYCVMPVGADNFTHGVQMLSEIFKALYHILLEGMGKTATNSSEDGGFAPPLNSSFEAMEILEKAVERAGYGDKICYALDMAASGLWNQKKKVYLFEGKERTTHEMIEWSRKLIHAFPKIVSIEDPLDLRRCRGHPDLHRNWRNGSSSVAGRQGLIAINRSAHFAYPLGIVPGQ